LVNCDKIFIVVYFSNFIGERFKICEIHVVTPQLLNIYCLGNAIICNIYIPFPNKKGSIYFLHYILRSVFIVI